MTISATEIMQWHHRLHRLNKGQRLTLSQDVTSTCEAEESMALSQLQVPAAILAGSGMATGGRVAHHLCCMLGDQRNTVIFAGFHAGGARGARLTNGEKHIKIFGKYCDVRARIGKLDFC